MHVTEAWRDLQQARNDVTAITAMGAPESEGPPQSEPRRPTDTPRRVFMPETSTDNKGRMERLTGRIAHDFNNILSVITSSVDLLLAKSESNDERLASLQDIRLAAKRGAELVNLLAASGQQQFLQPMVVDLSDLVRQLRRRIRSIVGKRVKVRFTLPDEPTCARVDPVQLRRAIMHVVQNAADAMPEGGTLTIDVEAIEVVGLMPCCPATNSVPCVMVAVSDTGIGMSESIRSRALEPFFSTKENKDGMGLACVRGIVNQSGGAIWLDSSPNEGTTVAIYLQRVSSLASAAPDEPPNTTTRPRLAPSILLVDDDAPVRRAIGRLLLAAGYTVIQAESPAEALDLAVKHQTTLGAVLTDIVMPGMNGLELVDRLSRIVPDVECMFMSGHSIDAISDPELANRCVPLMRKPVSKHELLASIRKLLDRAHWRHSVQIRPAVEH